MKSTAELAIKMCNYFDLRIGGSYRLIEIGMDESLVSDIDLIWYGQDKKDRFDNRIRMYLNDNGFTETIPPKWMSDFTYTEGSLIFKSKEYDLDLQIIEDSSVWSVWGILIDKFNRSTESDILQLQSIVNSMKPA